MKLLQQINNLRIYRNDWGWLTIKAPDGRALEEFHYLSHARDWARHTRDFVKAKGRQKETRS